MHERVELELAAAESAVAEGNDGKARVCARRAVGAAVTWLLTEIKQQGYGSDAMAQLERLKNDPHFPDDVRAAATRLTTSVRDRTRLPFTTDPIGDARVITDHIRARVSAGAAGA